MSALGGTFDEAVLLFFDESRDMLQQMEHGLLSLQDGPADSETINALFRAAHTIKGTSGIFNLSRVVDFTHQVESVLDRVRKGKLALDQQLSAPLLASCDMIATLLHQAEQGETSPAALAAADADAASLAQRLASFLEPGSAAAAGPAAAPGTPQVAPGASWHLSLRFGADTFRHGFDPLTIVQYLASLGQITGLATVEEALPPWEGFDPESCYLGFELRLATNASRQEIEAAFEFVGEQCRVRLIAPTRRADDYIALLRELPQEQRLGDLLVACGALSREALDTALASQQHQSALADGAADAAPPALGQILLAQQQVAPAVLDAALERQARAGAARADSNLFVRVPADKLDELINMVGELVICGASASTQAAAAGQPALIGTTQHLSRLIEDIRNGALGLRMVRIGETFVRYRRVVHDVGQELGKLATLEIEGADTELDKSVVEKIGDPLMHLVRNALDHGLELPEARVAAGKPIQGTITLAARHDSGNIVILVRDDGRGMDGEALLAKARERGLVAPGQHLSEAEKLELIFAPGFSTAAKVTNLSGRGVGMDVVRKNIEALRGSVRLSSAVGRYSEIEIRLPLTLAIIDGFLVRVSESAFVVPLHTVLECVDAVPSQLSLNERAAGFVRLRGEVLPVLDLRRVFGVQAPPPPRPRIVVVQGANGNAGLLVDRLDGEYQTVIKPLGKLFRQLQGISGSTVLGSGEVALILDVPALVKQATEQQHAANGAPERTLRRDHPTSGAALSTFPGEQS